MSNLKAWLSLIHVGIMLENVSPSLCLPKNNVHVLFGEKGVGGGREVVCGENMVLA